MGQGIKKRGQKIVKHFSRISKKASEEGKEHLRENVVDRISHIKNIKLLILEWSLLVLAIIALSITQSFLYTESYATSAYVKGGTYSEATIGRINSLNPLFANTDSEKALSKLMFSTLSAVDYSGHIGLGLADSIVTDDSGTIWTVRLRDNLKWSDGEPITNEDVVFTVHLIQLPTINSNYSTNLTNVQVSVSDDGNLIFTLPTAYANFVSALEFPILPEHILKDVNPTLLLEHTFSNSPITSGAFTFKASQAVGNTGEKVVYLTPNEYYYKGAPLVDSFAIHAYMETDDIITAINSGNVTATAALSPIDADEITATNIYEKQTALNSGVFAFFNTNSPVMSNKLVRQALQQGIDMRSLRAPLGDEEALDYPLLPDQLEVADLPKIPEYDPDAARAKLVSSGITEGQKITLATINTGYFMDLADNLRFQLERLGFSVVLNIMPPGQEFLMTVIRPRNYDILLYEIELGSDPDLFAYYHSSQVSENGLNLANYRNTIASDAVLAMRTTLDPNLKATKYKTFLKAWIDDVPAIGIYRVNLSYYVNKNVRSFSEDVRLVTPVDRFVDVQYWATERATKNRTP
ncbi:hypothetical protein IJG79_01120 [Candidatus Saccharibacteria bacterium]|nr:hypothetical protein [Candidatus Saccharibacteria bacterium]